MTKVVCVLFLALAVLLTPQSVRGAVAPPLNVADLVAQSDLIVVGQIVGIAEGEQASVKTSAGIVRARWRSGDLLIDHVLKGSFDRQVVPFRFVVTDVFIGYRTVGDQSYRLLFLKRRNQQYEFLTPYYPAFPAVPGAQPNGDSVLEKVLSLQTGVLRSGAAAPDEKREAIHVLANAGVQRPQTLEALRASLQDLEETVQLTAAAQLLLADDSSALVVAEQALLQPDPNLRSYTVGLQFGLRQGVKSASAIPTLVRLLNGGESETRKAVCAALGRTRSSAAIGPLLRALDDSDTGVRYTAVLALADVTGRSAERLSQPAFAADPDRYVEASKGWAKSR
jgi:hypothetical protein